MMYLDVIPPFEMMLYLLIVVLFLVTGFLNLKDLKKMRRDKWTRQDSVALMLRILVYAFLLNFLLTLVIAAGILLLTALRSLASLQFVLPLTLTSLELSFAVLLVTAVTYGLAKWKDWYDLVDAEY
ncbi:MAG: hypothetical protein ABSA92_11390 [Candidatus Bathyarchaeia archaeon]|jgi:hypothetical protein